MQIHRKAWSDLGLVDRESQGICPKLCREASLTTQVSRKALHTGHDTCWFGVSCLGPQGGREETERLHLACELQVHSWVESIPPADVLEHLVESKFAQLAYGHVDPSAHRLQSCSFPWPACAKELRDA